MLAMKDQEMFGKMKAETEMKKEFPPLRFWYFVVLSVKQLYIPTEITVTELFITNPCLFSSCS